MSHIIVTIVTDTGTVKQEFYNEGVLTEISIYCIKTENSTESFV